MDMGDMEEGEEYVKYDEINEEEIENEEGGNEK